MIFLYGVKYHDGAECVDHADSTNETFPLSDRIGPQCCERKQLERPEDGGDRKETHRDWNQEEF